jgi:vancomycin resistance protein VanJ
MHRSIPQGDCSLMQTDEVSWRLAARSGPPPPGYRRYFSRAVTWCVVLYLLAVLGVWLLMYVGGDRWWFPTVMLFGPKWIYAAPLAVLVPAAGLTRRRMLWPLLLAAIILAGPVMGLCVPWARLAAYRGPAIRALTCNVHENHVTNEVLAKLINELAPDVVALQECGADVHPVWPAGWNVLRTGELLVASRYTLDDEDVSASGHPPSPRPPASALHCVVRTPQGEIDLFNVHLRTPRRGLETVLDRRTVVSSSRSSSLAEAIQRRRRESEGLAQWIGGFSGPRIVVGDFNMPCESTIFRRCWAAYANAFSTAGFGLGHTKLSTIRGMSYGLRIDHILLGAGLKCGRCWVGPDIGSDHLPLVADLHWDAAASQRVPGR